MPSYILTSGVEIERIWSVAGVDLRLDDSEDAETLQEIIEEATTTVQMYLIQWYLPEVLYTSTWVRRKASFIAAYLLSLRRGNPGYYESMYERILEELQRIKDGEVFLPDLPMRSSMAPGMSNFRVNDNFAVAKTRVEPSISVGGIYSGQHTDPSYIWEPF